MRFVSVTNGDAGHHEMGGGILAARRRAEAQEVGKRLGIEYVVLDNHDGELVPSLDVRAEYAWAGSFGSSPTGTPTIGAVPRMAGCHAVMGYGGNGITFSMLGAQLLRGLITGEGDADAKLFSFHRRF